MLTFSQCILTEKSQGITYLKSEGLHGNRAQSCHKVHIIELIIDIVAIIYNTASYKMISV